MIQRSCVFLLAVLLLSLAAYPAAAQSSNYDRPPGSCVGPLFASGVQFVPPRSPEAVHEATTGLMQVFHDGVLRIVGEVVHLNAAEFPFLARSGAEPITDVRRFEVDAREIIIDMPLAFAAAEIDLRGRRVAFTGRGTIFLSAEPAPQRPQSVTIVSETFDLTRASIGSESPMIFGFTTQPWNSRPWAAPGRRIQVQAAEALLSPNASETIRANLADPARWTRFLHNLSQDAGRSDLDRAVQMYTADLADEISYREQEASTLQWPIIALARLSGAQAQMPHDNDMRAFILQRLADLDAIGRSDDPAFLMQLSDLRSRAEFMRDRYGQSAFDLPVESVIELIRMLASIESEHLGDGGSLERWDRAILAAASDPQVPADVFRAIDAQVADLQELRSEVASRMDAAIDALEGLEHAIDALLPRIEQERLIVEAARAHAERGERTSRDIEVGMRIVRAAAVITATAFGDPGVTQAVLIGSGALNTVGAIAAEHNRGVRSNLPDIVKTVEQVVADHREMHQHIELLSGVWRGRPEGQNGASGQPGLRETLGDLFGIAQPDGQSRADLARRAAGLVSEARPALSAIGSLVAFDRNVVIADPDEFYSTQPRWGALMDELTALEQSRAEQIAVINALMDELSAIGAELASVVEDRRALQVLRLDDAHGRVRTLAVMYWHRERSLDRLRRIVIDLMRAYAYAAGQSVPVPADQISLLFGELPPDILPEPAELEQLEQRLRQERARIANHVSTIRGAIEAAIQDRASPRFDIRTRLYAATLDDPNELHRTFVRLLNDDLARRLAQDGAGMVRTRLPIPISHDFWDIGAMRTIDAVVEVEFSDPSLLSRNSRLEFRVIHTGFGGVRRPDGCRVVTMRTRAANGEGWNNSIVAEQEYLASFAPAIEGAVRERISRAESRAQDHNWGSNWPLMGAYDLEVVLHERRHLSPQNPPQIEALRIHFVYVDALSR